MRNFKRWVVCIMCISMLFALFGCGKGDRHILDGPGMENPRIWESFSISRSDTYAPYNFHITVTYHEDGYITKVTTIDEEEQEFVLPKSACCEIDKLNPQALPDVSNEELIIPDAPDVEIEVGYMDGTRIQKTDYDDFSMQVYKIVMPYSKYGIIESF